MSVSYLETFVRHNLDVEYVDDVPKVVFVCWFGGYKTPGVMSAERYAAFVSLVSTIGAPVILLTEKNISSFVEVHPAFEFLSGVHKADYARAAVLDKYGGGYHDVKHRSESWSSAWDDDSWTRHDDIWLYCRRETEPGHIGYQPIAHEYSKLGTMSWVIAKPGTPYTRELLAQIEAVLDEYKDKLRQYPGKNPGGYYSDKPFSEAPLGSYPLRWLQLLGEIFHPLMLKYSTHLKFGLPDAQPHISYK